MQHSAPWNIGRLPGTRKQRNHRPSPLRAKVLDVGFSFGVAQPACRFISQVSRAVAGHCNFHDCQVLIHSGVSFRNALTRNATSDPAPTGSHLTAKSLAFRPRRLFQLTTTKVHQVPIEGCFDDVPSAEPQEQLFVVDIRMWCGTLHIPCSALHVKPRLGKPSRVWAHPSFGKRPNTGASLVCRLFHSKVLGCSRRRASLLRYATTLIRSPKLVIGC